jgi:hypothetical protein
VTAKDQYTMRLLKYITIHAGIGIFYTTLESSFKLEKLTVFRVFFKKGRLELNQVFRETYPLLTGINSYAGGPVIQELISLGADPGGTSYLEVRTDLFERRCVPEVRQVRSHFFRLALTLTWCHPRSGTHILITTMAHLQSWIMST